MASAQPTSTSKKDEAGAEPKADQQAAQQKPAAALEEDDEFEDFPVDGTSPPPHPPLPKLATLLRRRTRQGNHAPGEREASTSHRASG